MKRKATEVIVLTDEEEGDTVREVVDGDDVRECLPEMDGGAPVLPIQLHKRMRNQY